MINNYFLLYHSTNYVDGEESLLLNFKDKNFDKIAALILTIEVNNLDYYLELEEFKKLYKNIIINGFLDVSTLYEFCFLVLNRLKQNNNLVRTYLDVFNYLQSKDLLSKQNNDKLQTIFEALSLEVKPMDSKNNDFILNKEILNSSLENIKTYFESKSLLNELNKIQNYMDNQVFSIGITGVMNVGKSTFINALLSTELLGSSVVAETANLSIIKYSDKPYTKVRFFNKVEFDEMVHTFSDNEEQKSYIDGLKDSFDIDEFVQENAKVIEIRREDLHKYTSASDKSGFCHIVKDVELGVDLEFLKNSIEIVDTPGLDDSLIIRETVTQGYVADCDLLIHLMNVNQSATQKDVDFIIDSIVNQNVTNILILLTKADNVSEEELEQVIAYTKTSIENQLSALGNDSNILKVISKLKFLSISAKIALDIRKNSTQDTQSDNLKKSGVLEVENHLHDTLFSENFKNELIIQSASKRMQESIKTQVKIYQYNLELYSKDESALEDELKFFNETKEKKKNIFRKVDSQISEEKEIFVEFVKADSLVVDAELSELKSKILQRVTDEISYTLKKNSVELKELQLKMIIDKSLNHGFIDIVREHKYKIERKVENISKNIKLSLNKYNVDIDEVGDIFSMQSLFDKNSSSTLTSSSKMLLKQLVAQSKGLKLSKIPVLKDKFSNTLDDEFKYIKIHLQTTLKELNEVISTTFFEVLKEPINKLQDEMHDYETSLEKQIFSLKNKDEDIEELKIDIQHKINSLQAILKSLS